MIVGPERVGIVELSQQRMSRNRDLRQLVRKITSRETVAVEYDLEIRMAITHKD